MEIKVLFFAQLEELFGVSEMKIQNQETIDDIIQYLTNIQPRLENQTYVIAINQQLMQQNIPLKNNDVVALLPPFAGG